MAIRGEMNNLREEFENYARGFARIDDGTRSRAIAAALDQLEHHFMPSHLAPFGNATRLAHDTMSVFHRQLTDRFITMRASEATLGDAEAKRIHRLESKQEMLKIIEKMEATIREVADFEEAFHEAYDESVSILRTRVEDIEDNEVDDGSPVIVPTAEREVAIGESRFRAIPPEVDLAIQSFLPLTDRMRGARVNHVFHRAVQPLVPELLYQNMREFNDFYCRLWQTFGPVTSIGQNDFTWRADTSSYALHGSSAREIQLNHEKMAWECAWTITQLLEMEAGNPGKYYPNEVGPAIERIIEELAPTVSVPFQKIMRESLETANLIRKLARGNEPEEWQNAVDSLTEFHSYSHAMLVADRSPERRVQYSCEVIRRAALSDRELAALLASRFLLWQEKFERIVQIVQSWPDETHAACKDEILHKIERTLELRKMNRRHSINEKLLLELHQYLDERKSRAQSEGGEPVESKEAEP